MSLKADLSCLRSGFGAACAAIPLAAQAATVRPAF